MRTKKFLDSTQMTHCSVEVNVLKTTPEVEQRVDTPENRPSQGPKRTPPIVFQPSIFRRYASC